MLHNVDMLKVFCLGIARYSNITENPFDLLQMR